MPTNPNPRKRPPVRRSRRHGRRRLAAGRSFPGRIEDHSELARILLSFPTGGIKPRPPEPTHPSSTSSTSAAGRRSKYRPIPAAPSTTATICCPHSVQGERRTRMGLSFLSSPSASSLPPTTVPLRRNHGRRQAAGDHLVSLRRSPSSTPSPLAVRAPARVQFPPDTTN